MKGRFARIPEHALKADLPLRALRVLIAIGLYADPAGWAWPSLDTIAEVSGIDRRDVLRALTELETAGVIHRHRETSGGKGKSTRYQIVGMPERTGGKSPPLSSANRGEITPSLTAQTGGDLGTKQGGNSPPEHTRTERKDSERARVCEEEWKEFWAVYPGRGGYPDPETPARREFEAAVDRGVAAADIIAGAGVWAAQIAENGTEPRFVKAAKNWLKDEGWLDRPRPPVRRRPKAGMA